jgi:hypothetical protein
MKSFSKESGRDYTNRLMATARQIGYNRVYSLELQSSEMVF